MTNPNEYQQKRVKEISGQVLDAFRSFFKEANAEALRQANDKPIQPWLSSSLLFNDDGFKIIMDGIESAANYAVVCGEDFDIISTVKKTSNKNVAINTKDISAERIALTLMKSNEHLVVKNGVTENLMKAVEADLQNKLKDSPNNKGYGKALEAIQQSMNYPLLHCDLKVILDSIDNDFKLSRFAYNQSESNSERKKGDDYFNASMAITGYKKITEAFPSIEGDIDFDNGGKSLFDFETIRSYAKKQKSCLVELGHSPS